jgi:hypothetical protein
VIILMAQPWCHPETGVWYLRYRLPADLAKSLGGQKATFEVAGTESTVKLAPIFKVSLRTKDAGEARLRHASVQAQVQERWAAARDGAVSLTNKEITALAGIRYRHLLSPVCKPSAVLFGALQPEPRQHSPRAKRSWPRRELMPMQRGLKSSAVLFAGPGSRQRRQLTLTWKLRGGSCSSPRARPRRSVLSKRRRGCSQRRSI